MERDLQHERLTRVVDHLRGRLGDRISLDTRLREARAQDACHHVGTLPDAVAFPQSIDDVVAVARSCSQHGVPMIPFGTGTGVEGGIVPVQGGLTIDLSRMDRILELQIDDRDALVQAGVTRLQLNDELRRRGTQLHFPVDPGADASLGGMAATRASGSSAVRYGTMRENVLGITAVLADGRVIRTGTRARKSSAGYDLTRLLVGSEGTLAIIAEVRLRLHPVPDKLAVATVHFPSIDQAIQAARDVLAANLPVGRVELLDALQMQAVVAYSQLDCTVAPTLFFEFHTGENADRIAHTTRALTEACGGERFQWATDAEQRKRLWQARYDSYYAALALRPGSVGYVTDVCVPQSQLTACINAARREMATTEIPSTLFGHIGDGNFHVVFLIEPGNQQEQAEVAAVHRRIVERALATGGTCTGEHGIGLGKIEALKQEAGTAHEVMWAIKRALDPLGLMNPGKVLGPPGRTA